MLWRIVALTILALAGSGIVLPEASARPAGIPSGARIGGFRTPFAAPRPPRIGSSQHVLRAYGAILQRPFVPPAWHPPAHATAHGMGRNIGADLRSRHVRHHHHGSVAGYGYPFTYEDYGATPYLGMPYDPAEAIPVYAPPTYSVPAEEDEAAPRSRPLAPRFTGTRVEGQDACRSERVTVPETSGAGEREILVVRC
jgi:hypothetical protein